MPCDDLDGAARFARYLASAAGSIHAMLEAGEGIKPARRFIPTPVQADGSVYTLTEAGDCESPVKYLLHGLNKDFDKARDGIRSVVMELRLTRDSAIRLGDIVAPTAHEAAVKMVYLLNQQWFGVEIIGQKVQAWPDTREVIAEIELENTKAKYSRTKADTAPEDRTTRPAETSVTLPTPSLSTEEAAVLKTLRQAKPVTMTVEKIATKVSLAEKTIRKCVRSMRDQGLVEEPAPKKGYGLTSKGLALATQLQADAGRDFLRSAKPSH